MIRTKLTPEECHLALTIAGARMLSSGVKNLVDSVNKKEWIDAITVHIHGAIGEIGFCKAVGAHWPAYVDRFKTFPDVGLRTEIRHRVKHEHDLIVRKDDTSNRLYVLTTGTPEDFRVHGGLLGKDAKKAKWLKSYGGKVEAYFIPSDYLTPIEALGDW